MAGFAQGLIGAVRVIPRVLLDVINVVNLKVGIRIATGAALPIIALKNVEPLLLPPGVTEFLGVGHNQ